MAIDFTLYATFAAFATFGAVVRTLLGIYKAYNTFPEFTVNWKRISFEIIASIFFGTFGIIMLNELHVFTFGLTIAAAIAGLLGADTINLITKKLGLTKGLQVIVSEQQMVNADLNDREVRAIDYVSRAGKINNSVYQKINFTSHDVAKKELQKLVNKGRLKKVGNNRRTHYVRQVSENQLKNQLGQLRVVSRAPEERYRR